MLGWDVKLGEGLGERWKIKVCIFDICYSVIRIISGDIIEFNFGRELSVWWFCSMRIVSS